MVVAVQPEFPAHVDQLTSVDDERIARRTSAESMEGAFDLCIIVLDDRPREAEVLVLCEFAHERPPDFPVECRRIHAELIVDMGEISIGHRCREVVEDEDLDADHGVDRIRPAMCEHCHIDTEICLIVTLHPIIHIDMAVAKAFLPDERNALCRGDLHLGIGRERRPIDLRRVAVAAVKAEPLRPDEEVRDHVDPGCIRRRPHIGDTDIREQRRINRVLVLLPDLLHGEECPAAAHIAHDSRQHRHALEMPRRKRHARIGIIERDILIDRMALVCLALFRQQLLHIVPRIHTQHIRWIVEDKELLLRHIPVERFVIRCMVPKQAIGECTEMEEAVKTTVLKKTSEEERNEEEDVKTALIHALHLHPNTVSPALPRC